MCDYLGDLEKAFQSVNKSYYSQNAYQGEYLEDTERESYEQYSERVFAYELYHQFRRIIENNPSRYENLVLNGEIRKNGFKNTEIMKDCIYPDLVLHKDQENSEEKHQTLFIEIKVSHNPNLKEDIKKLIVAVGTRLNYQNAVFICINKNVEELKKKINEIEELACLKDSANSLRKLWLLTENGLENFGDFVK